MDDLELPPTAEYVRTTPTFTEDTVPAGLLAAHQVASGNWAELRVISGTLGFAFADESDVRSLVTGERQAIPPARPHRVVVTGPVTFELDFYRMGSRVGMLGINPDAFGIWDARAPGITPWSAFLDAVAEIGYQAVELGPAGYLPTGPRQLGAELQARSLQLTCGYVAVKFHDPESRATMFDQLQFVGNLTAGAGAQFVLALARPRPGSNRTPPDGADIQEIADGLLAMTRTAKEEYGLQLVFHPHVGMAIETEEETVRLLEAGGGELALCFDVGQFAYAGGDPADFITRFPDAIEYVHLRDVDPVVRHDCLADQTDFETAARRDVFCEPGSGMVDFGRVVAALTAIGFEGPAIVERSYLDRTPDEAKAAAARSFESYSSFGFGN